MYHWDSNYRPFLTISRNEATSGYVTKQSHTTLNSLSLKLRVVDITYDESLSGLFIYRCGLVSLALFKNVFYKIKLVSEERLLHLIGWIKFLKSTVSL